MKSHEGLPLSTSFNYTTSTGSWMPTRLRGMKMFSLTDFDCFQKASFKFTQKAMLTPLPTLPSSARREMELNSVLQYFYKGASPSVMTTSLFFVARNPFSQSCCK
jgi:hypothetical protein